jgi:hypothetical protein
MTNDKITAWHVGVAAEAFAAGMFARLGYDVSVQYGANQPGYDLIVAKSDSIIRISVKGSQDGGWGLTQGYVENADYHKAADDWLKDQNPKIIFCLVQFQNTKFDESPRFYLATAVEIADQLKRCSNGRGNTALQEDYLWKAGVAAGVRDKLPDSWRFTHERIEELLIVDPKA